jgi:uncharacterized protein (TIGR02001 family)
MQTSRTIRGLVLGVGAAALVSGAALAADIPVKVKPAPAPPTPLFDIAFGAALMTDYNFRGVSQSDRKWSGGAYVEFQYNSPVGTWYAGLAAWRIDWPFAYGFTDPSAEVDVTAGWRNSWGPLSLDLGYILYYYPGERFNGFTTQSDFWEIYAKLGYNITPDLSVGVNVFYTPDLLHYSTTIATITGVATKADAVYASLTGKWTTPLKIGDIGTYVSGELGHWWIDNTGFIASGYLDPSYTYWNIGLAFTFKQWTLDLRYHGNDMNVFTCASFLLSAVPNPSNRWCGDAFIASLKFDATLSSLR